MTRLLLVLAVLGAAGWFVDPFLAWWRDGTLDERTVASWREEAARRDAQ